MPCSICQSFEHLVEECPTIPAMREMFGDQANGTSVHATWQAPPQASNLEQAIVNLSKVVGDFVGDQKSINAQLSQRIDSVESTLNKMMDGMQNDLSQKIDNLSSGGESSQVREVKAVITLRSGKEVDLPTSKPEHEPRVKQRKRRGRKSKERKREQCKEEDLESTIRLSYHLSDDWRDVCGESFVGLGASVNLLPYSVYKQLGLGELKPTSITLSLADRSVKIPRGMIEDVLVQVDKFYYQWILLFLIRTQNGVMQLTFGNMTLELNIFYLCKKQFHLEEEEGPEEVCMIDNLVEEHCDQKMLEDLNESLGDLDEGLPEPSDLLATLPPWKRREEILSLFNGEETQEAVKEEPPKLILKPLPTELKYAYLEENKQALLLFLHLLPLLRRIVYLKSSGDVRRR
ncbi:hypothetical protein CK203_109806 [Vitis vinifera]|uniref:Uncharacterized protein n=1 Tax=Vitis vinifera TaxID=29760 RepID=A0A438FE32_VITVI|nr:hypothetical protein CK203_109806 [Vitis vinifera]